MSARDLYQDLLVEHARHPRNFGPLPEANRTAQGSNPLCGDELVLRLRLNQERVEEIAFEGAGCAVCVASASMMTAAVKGRAVEEVAALMQRVRTLVAGGDVTEMGDLASLAGVSRFPSRVKCVLLSWRALEAALASEGGAVSTEL